jgi:hypothetical protein
MHDIVAVEVRLTAGERRYFLTWGRIQDVVDPAPLAAVVLRNAHRFAIEGEATTARVLWTLHPAVDTPGFWDAFFDMCQRRIPFGKRTYPRWRNRIAQRQDEGKEIWYLGHWVVPRDGQPDRPDAALPNGGAGSDSHRK